MNNVRCIAATALLAMGMAGAVQAQTLPTPEDFSRHSEVTEVTMSPNGDYIAMAVPVDGGLETQLQIVALDGVGSTQTLRFGKQQLVADVLWSDDTQLVVSRAQMEPLKARPVSFGELMSSDIHGKTQETLFAYVRDQGNQRGRRKDNGFASVVKVLENEPGSVLVRYTCWNCGEEPPTAIYKVNTRTGGRELVERVEGSAGFIFDRSGRARVLTTLDDNDEPVLHYRPGASDDWVPLPEALAGRSIDAGTFDTDNNTLYAQLSDSGEPSQLYKLDLEAGTRTKLTGRDNVEVAYTLKAGRNGIPFAVLYNADQPSIEYLDKEGEWAKLHRSLIQSFPGQMLSFSDVSRDGRKILFYVRSDRNPGAYYVFDRDTSKAQLVTQLQPWIKPEQMAATRPIAFTARDGQKLYGFYTAIGSGPKPLVVMPHGGPFGPYDQWGYDSDAQFLASRGYAVLQVNFRGSGGRGHDFEKAAWRQWGGLIQDDIADGVRHVIAQEMADPDRVCIYGASFGGYSALMNPIRYPDLYKCAIGYVGVYDLTLLRETDGTTRTKGGRRFLDRQVGTDEAMLAATSPAQQVAQLKVPVMLVHGRDDSTAKFDQFRVMEAALKDANHSLETLVVAGEGHGFYKPENRAELYRRMEQFLDKYIGADAK